jgi:hypothetical protein
MMMVRKSKSKDFGCLGQMDDGEFVVSAGDG